MSVDYYNCAKCGCIVTDNDCEWCEHCHRTFCYGGECSGFEEQDNVKDDDGEEVEVSPKCCICQCTFDDMSNVEAFPILLEVYGMSRETAMKLIKGHLLNKK